jgi:hypothetical protein
MGTQRVHLTEPFLVLVHWARHVGKRDFCPALAALVINSSLAPFSLDLYQSWTHGRKSCRVTYLLISVSAYIQCMYTKECLPELTRVMADGVQTSI